MKILIVDDDQGILNALGAGLTAFGYEVVTANNPRDGLREIETSLKVEESIGFLVTDLRMPGMDGLELIRTARKLQPNIRSILMTAYGDRAVERKAMSLGNCGYLEKPFGPDVLLERIRALAKDHDDATVVVVKRKG